MSGKEKEEKVIELFKKFPGIGQRQAERFARFIAQANTQYIKQTAESIVDLNTASRQCPKCFIHHQQHTEICSTCTQGNTETLIVVEKDADAQTLIASSGNVVEACYFILGGLIPIANSEQKQVRTSQLIQSVRERQPTEVIIALSVHPDADHTARQIITIIQKEFPEMPVTTLGRGLSSGSELEYSDPETLISALKHRSSATKAAQQQPQQHHEIETTRTRQNG